ncbi:MAG: sulfur carrier protein ThiS [Bacteroides sp.]|nr:sulfur carrier protein ThiS [Bacteroides sp.]
MKVFVNDKEVETGAATLSQLSQELNLPAAGIAVAVNNRIIPRTEWDAHPLAEGDKVIVIKAVCGG